jgi:hypothetical protein
VVVVLLGTVVYAHHSHPDFLLDQNVAVEGQIEGIQFKNPHVLITIRSVDSTIYTAEWNTVRALRATEVTNDTLKIGDHIIVIGCPPRDPAVHELVTLKQLRRLSDGWIWSPHWLVN